MYTCIHVPLPFIKSSSHTLHLSQLDIAFNTWNWSVSRILKESNVHLLFKYLLMHFLLIWFSMQPSIENQYKNHIHRCCCCCCKKRGNIARRKIHGVITLSCCLGFNWILFGVCCSLIVSGSYFVHINNYHWILTHLLICFSVLGKLRENGKVNQTEISVCESY